MKISKQTLEILNNFSSLNINFVFKEGKRQSSITKSKNRMVEVEFDEVFPSEFGVYDLKKFVKCILNFEDPDLIFNENFVRISDKNNEAIFSRTDKELLTCVNKSINFPEPVAEFSLDKESLKSLIKYSRLMEFDYLILESDGLKTVARIQEKSNKFDNTFQVNLAMTDQTFKVAFTIKGLDLIEDDYLISISDKGICRFKSKNSKLTYFIATEKLAEVSIKEKVEAI
jgi:hypothetical protein